MIENKPCFGPSEGSSGLPAWLAVLGWSLSAAKWCHPRSEWSASAPPPHLRSELCQKHPRNDPKVFAKSIRYTSPRTVGVMVGISN